MSPRAAAGAPQPLLEGFDPVTGLALSPRFAMRVRDVLSAGTRAGPLVVGSLRLENHAALCSHHPAHALRAIHGCADALRAAMPFVHSLGRTGDAELCFLLPNAGDDPDESAKRTIRRAAERLARDTALNFPQPLQVAFGYAVCPRDGADVGVLIEVARGVRARIGGRAR